MQPTKNFLPEYTHRSEAHLHDLTEPELHKLLVQWNATDSPYPDTVALHHLIEAQVEKTPQRTALIFEGQTRTYRELNSEANQLARQLQLAGVKPDMLVGVCMERSLEMVISLLAVLKAGGVYLPLDPTYPHERLAYMIQDAQVTVLLTQSHLRECLPVDGVMIIAVDLGWNAEIAGDEGNPVSSIQADHLAYMIYTSGSTGQPKGVMNTHRGICNRLHWMQQTYQLTHEDRILQKTPFSFDVSVWEFFWPLLAGATLVIARPGGHQDPVYIADTIEAQHITTLHFVPSMLQIFLFETNLEQRCRGLKRVICSGEALSVDLQERFFARFPEPVQLHNLYGPTEAAIDVTAWQCQRGDKQGSVPIGYPIANIQIYILDPEGRPVPIGVAGELYIGGVGVARGYHNRPELTAEKFIRDPFSNNRQARLFKTGDLARYRADGAIEFLGRIDHQVKIRGVRIELEEIEVALRHHPGVRDAVVVAYEVDLGDKRLIAYLVPSHNQENTTPAVNALQEHLMRSLPAFMVPSAFVWLDALPLTSNGKVDRRALPALDLTKRTLEGAFVAPTSMNHHLLKQIWEDLLNVQPIGMKDNFFYIGGHSLLATRLMDRIEQVFGNRLSLATLFAGPTIEQLVLALETKEVGRIRAPIVAVQSSGSKRPFFYLHGAWDSDAFYCFQLARYFTDQPFYALAPYHFEGGDVILTVEEMAMIHLQSIQRIQPEGPYVLGGFCNGGVLAYEIARQLQAQGERVERLVLIEPGYASILHVWARGVVNLVACLFGFTREKRIEYFLRFRHIFKYIGGQRKSVADLKGFSDIDPSILTLTPTTYALLQDQYALFDWIIAGYNYAPYDDKNKIKMIWAQKEPYRGVWRRKEAQENTIEVEFVPGTHVGCRTEYVQYLAEALERSLNQPQAIELKGGNSCESIAVSVDQY